MPERATPKWKAVLLGPDARRIYLAAAVWLAEKMIPDPAFIGWIKTLMWPIIILLIAPTLTHFYKLAKTAFTEYATRANQSLIVIPEYIAHKWERKRPNWLEVTASNFGIVSALLFLVLLGAAWLLLPSKVVIREPLATESAGAGWKEYKFDLLRRDGSALLVGDCPEGDCLIFQLHEIATMDGEFVQRFTLSGSGAGLCPTGPRQGEICGEVSAADGVKLLVFGADGIWDGYFLLDPGAELQSCSYKFDTRIRLSSIESRSLGISLWVRRGTAPLCDFSEFKDA